MMNEKNANNLTDTPNRSQPPTEALLDWYAVHRRRLPWRDDPTPYHIWLSEIMLQQTRVEAVRGYYDRFLTALPDISTLAKAGEDTCLKLWEGLGYYSRVRNLRKAAIQIMTEHGGCMPRTSSDLQKLAGIGPYTSAAIASICFGERIPAIDGNLLRVFARMTGYDQDIKSDAAKRTAREWYLEIFPAGSGAADSASGETCLRSGTAYSAPGTAKTAHAANTVPGAADAALTASPRPAGSSTSNPCGDMNQALMDLGATICLPNGQPLCGDCPWADYCRARADGRQQELPVTTTKKARPVSEKTIFLIYSDQKIALRKRPARGLLAGLYEFPNTDGKLSRADATAYLQTLGFSPVRMRRLPATKHIFTHREWRMTGWEVLADECAEFAANRKGGTSNSTEAPGAVFLATAKELDEVYSIPSAFARYQKEIRRDYL